MRRIAFILAVVIATLATMFVIQPAIMLQRVKRRAETMHANERALLNTVPLAPSHQLPINDYTNATWCTVSGVRFGFPDDRFTHDSNSKRENKLLHSHYRLLVMQLGKVETYVPVMEAVGETNFFQFIRAAFNATEHDIQKQRTMRDLQRHLLLLETKRMLAPVGFEEGCAEFDRGDLKGFIMGDPVRSKYLYVRCFLASEQSVDLGLIPNAPLHMSDLEELLSNLKVEYQ